MSHELTEKQVLKKLGIEDFRHLTKSKVIQLASMLDSMDPEVAKKALEQFPEFAKTSKEILIDYKETIDKGIVSNDKSMQAVYNMYSSILESLQKELDKPDLSFEDKKYIIEQMKVIGDKVDKKDTENKRWISGMFAVVSMVTVGAIATLASVLGTRANIENNDDDDDNNA